jgi:predicted alpha/beta-hydrolase family hydrolase
MTRVARELRDRGILVVTFDFPYMAAGRKVPDKAPVLEQAWRAQIDAVRADGARAAVKLFIGGKSMGGRMASHVAAQGVAGISGLVFLGYPLHPPGKPQQRRDAHLPSIRQPMLFVQGERDEFGSAQEIRELLPALPHATLHVVAGGDHSLKVRARGPLSQDDVFQGVADTIAAWMARITSAPSEDRR